LTQKKRLFSLATLVDSLGKPPHHSPFLDQPIGIATSVLFWNPILVAKDLLSIAKSPLKKNTSIFYCSPLWSV